MSEEAVLCYVDGCFAYFTTQPLDKQWGDDWNDAPYEHNAGRPYSWRPEKWDSDLRKNVPNDEPSWDILQVAYEANFDTPAEGPGSWSVEQINAGRVPWLAANDFSRHKINIPAGTTIGDFIALVRLAGGKTYIEAE